MKKLLGFLVFAGVVAACNNNSTDSSKATTDSTTMSDSSNKMTADTMSKMSTDTTHKMSSDTSKKAKNGSKKKWFARNCLLQTGARGSFCYNLNNSTSVFTSFLNFSNSFSCWLTKVFSSNFPSTLSICSWVSYTILRNALWWSFALES